MKRAQSHKNDHPNREWAIEQFLIAVCGELPENIDYEVFDYFRYNTIIRPLVIRKLEEKDLSETTLARKFKTNRNSIRAVKKWAVEPPDKN